MIDNFDGLVLFVGAVLIALEHGMIRHTPNLIRYSAGTLVLLGIILLVLNHHGLGGWAWIPLLAVGVTGATTTALFVLDGLRDVVRLWRSEGPMPLRAFGARLVALYRRTHGEGR